MRKQEVGKKKRGSSPKTPSHFKRNASATCTKTALKRKCLEEIPISLVARKQDCNIDMGPTITSDFTDLFGVTSYSS
jgi:hypothetical protein